MPLNFKPMTFIIPFHQPWDRPADFQRQTCLRLAKNHRVIALLESEGVFWLKALWLWIKGFRTHLPNSNGHLSFSRPIYLLPGKRWPPIHQLNQQLWLWWLWLKLHAQPKQNQVWLWLFEPNFWFYPTTIPNWRSLYDCVDDHTQINSHQNPVIKLSESVLILNVNLFVTNSQVLADLHSKTRLVDKVVVQGFDTALWPKQLPKLPKNQTSLLLIGALDERIDWSLLKYLAKQLPKLVFNLAGPIDSKVKPVFDQLVKESNVIYHGVLAREKLTQLLKEATICLIPYRNQLLSVKNSFPMKVLEYFAFGKSVIACPITELKHYRQNLIIAETKAEWLQAIKSLIDVPAPKSERQLQRQTAWQHRYEQKLNQILNLIQTEES